MMKVILICTLMLGFYQPPAGSPAAGPQKKEGEGNSDLQKLTPAVLQDLSRRIETALVGDVGTGTLGLKVVVEDQMLVLTGDAPDEAARKRAADIATSVANDELYRIANRVRIRPAGDVGASKKPGVTDVPTAPDLAQLERVDAILRDKLPELSRTIRARFQSNPIPCIVLEGVVDTMEQKLEVSRVIRAEVRSLPLLNNIQLRIKQNNPPPRQTADTKQPRAIGGGPQNKAVAIDSDTREEDVPLAGTIANKVMGDSRIFDTVVLIQADGGLIWLKGTVETFAMKVRCVNHAQRSGATSVIDDLTVAVALRGAKELSVAKQRDAVSTEVVVDEGSVSYFKRYLSETVPVPGAYVVEAKEGQIRVVLKANLLTPEQLKRVSDAVQKMAADLGVKAVIDVQPAAGAVVTPPPAP